MQSRDIWNIKAIINLIRVKANHYYCNSYRLTTEPAILPDTISLRIEQCSTEEQYQLQ